MILPHVQSLTNRHTSPFVTYHVFHWRENKAYVLHTGWSGDRIPVKCPYRPTPELTQPLVQLAQGLFAGSKAASAWHWPPTPHEAVRSKRRPTLLLPTWVFTGCSGVNFTFYVLHTRRAPRPTQPHTNVHRGLFLLELEANFSCLCNAKVKNE
jgi:hypothetical protein